MVAKTTKTQGNHPVFFMHTDPEIPGLQCNRATVACKIDGETIQYGVAICSDRDNFSREKGRELAYRRLIEGFGVTKFQNGFFESFERPEAALYEFSITLGRAIKKNYNKYKRRLEQHKLITAKQK